MRIAGIDPGANGAICVLDSKDPGHIGLWGLKKNPIYETANWLHNQHVEAVWIEDVHSIHGTAAKSNFTFGKNLGYVTAISEIVTQGNFSRLVTPKVWQKYIGVNVKGPAIKIHVAQIAKSIYPAAIIHGPKGGLLDGYSDALMIAHYGLNHS
jgi:hypothetical protein